METPNGANVRRSRATTVMPSDASKLSMALKFLKIQGDCSICWVTSCLKRYRESENEMKEPVRIPNIETGIVNKRPFILLWNTCEYVNPNMIWFRVIGKVIIRVVEYNTLMAPIAWNG